MGLLPTQGDEKTTRSSNRSRWNRCPFLCHPVDKPKGVVKGEGVRRVAVSNSLAMSLETWRHASPLCESFSVERLLPPAIDTDEN